jgi:hypothetical protein
LPDFSLWHLGCPVNLCRYHDLFKPSSCSPLTYNVRKYNVRNCTGPVSNLIDFIPLLQYLPNPLTTRAKQMLAFGCRHQAWREIQLDQRLEMTELAVWWQSEVLAGDKGIQAMLNREEWVVAATAVTVVVVVNPTLPLLPQFLPSGPHLQSSVVCAVEFPPPVDSWTSHVGPHPPGHLQTTIQVHRIGKQVLRLP